MRSRGVSTITGVLISPELRVRDPTDKGFWGRLSVKPIFNPVGRALVRFQSDTPERMELILIDPKLVRCPGLSDDRFHCVGRAQLVELALNDEQRTGNLLDVLPEVVKRGLAVECRLAAFAG